MAALESCYQLLLWLIPVLDGMPRRQKFLLGDRIQVQAQRVLDCLIEAAHARQREPLLRQANLDLDRLCYGVRLAKDLALPNFRQYEHAARLIADGQSR